MQIIRGLCISVSPKKPALNQKTLKIPPSLLPESQKTYKKPTENLSLYLYYGYITESFINEFRRFFAGFLEFS